MLSPLSPAGQPDQPDPSRASPVTGMPVVGMVGGGQLARMTAAAAVGLGATFRVLAESENESAALVTHDVTVGSHLSLPDIAAFAAECDVITFDHEHVPGPDTRGARVSRGAGPPGQRRARLHPGQARDARAAQRARRALPAVRAGRVGGRRGEVRRGPAEYAWPVVLKAVSGGYDGKGVWVCDSPSEAAEVVSHRHRPAGRGVRAVQARARGAGREVAVRSGRRVPGGADRSGGRHLPGGDRARARGSTQTSP